MEYAPNKLFATGYPTPCIFLFDNWASIKCIHDPNSSNIDKTFAFVVPSFDAENFPFIAVCGKSNLSLVNVKDCSF